MGKTKPWSRTKSQQKVWNRRPTSQRFRETDEDEDDNKIRASNDGMKIRNFYRIGASLGATMILSHKR